MLRHSILFLFIYSLLGTFSFAEDQKLSVTAEAFGELPYFDQIELSPDGMRMASIQNLEGHLIFVTQSFHAEDKQKLYLSSYDKYEINWFHWVNDSRLIISLGLDYLDGYVRYRVTRMVAVNWDKSDQIQLLKKDLGSQFHDDMVSILPDDPDHILMALDKSIVNYPDVYKVNINDGSKHRHLKNRSSVRRWMADGKGIVRLGLGKHKNINKLIFRNDEGQEWRTLAKYDVIDGEEPFSPEGFSELPNVIYVSKLDENGRKAFYRYDTETGAFLDQVASNDKVDISDLMINKKGEVTGYSFLDEVPKTVYKTEFYKSLQIMLSKNFPDHMVWTLTKSRDKKKFIFKVTGPDLPGDIYYLNLLTKELFKLFSTNPKVDTAKLSDMNIVRYNARDGLEIPAYISFPKGYDLETAKKLPTVIMPHGGPFARDGYGYDYWVQFLTTRGYAVLQMNYRGSTGYGTAFMKKGYHEWGRKMLEDINDGTKWAISQGYADPAHICIMGGSYGGYAALEAVVKDQSLYKCSISMAPVTDVNKMLRDGRYFLDYKRYQFYVRNDDLSASDISPINHIDKINIPVLLIHGTDDATVPYKHGADFAKKMKKKRKDFKFVTLKKEDHYLSRQETRIKFLKEVEKFLKKYL